MAREDVALGEEDLAYSELVIDGSESIQSFERSMLCCPGVLIGLIRVSFLDRLASSRDPNEVVLPRAAKVVKTGNHMLETGIEFGVCIHRFNVAFVSVDNVLRVYGYKSVMKQE